MSALAERVEALQKRIQQACESCNRSPSSVELLPISKKQPLSMIEEAVSLSFRSFGENYIQEGTAKALARPNLNFILVGPLQRNKAKQALQHFKEIQSVDRMELILRLQRLAEELGLIRPVWIQVDLWNESSKVGGCSESKIPELINVLQKNSKLSLKGLMAIPPPGFSKAFQQLSILRQRLQDQSGQKLLLSMGMSEDLEAAIAAGSDQIRIGTAFFGERPMPI